MSTEGDKIEEFCRLMRESFIGAEGVYTRGSCYRFAEILMFTFPGGEIYTDQDHAIYNYQGQFYDITGITELGNHMPQADFGDRIAKKQMDLQFDIFNDNDIKDAREVMEDKNKR